MAKLTTIQTTTLTALFELQSASTHELAKKLDTSDSAARKRLRKLESLGLVESETTEGTASNGSSALKHVDWHVDIDDDDVRLALGMNPVTENVEDRWVKVEGITERSDGYRNVMCVSEADGWWTVVEVTEEFVVNVDDRVLVECGADGHCHITDVRRQETPAETSAPAPTLNITITPRRPKLVITSADLAPAPAVVVTTPEPAPLPRLPSHVPTGDESPLPVNLAATASLTAGEQRAELAWMHNVCRDACAFIDRDWDDMRITLAMNTRYTRCLGKAYCVSPNWDDPVGRVVLSGSYLWRRASKAERRNTVVHELAHVLAHAYSGQRVQPHGQEWRRMHRSLGETPSTTHNVGRHNPAHTFNSLSELAVGMTIKFGNPTSEMTLATVIKVGRKRVMVAILEPRGRRRVRPVGAQLRVPLHMIVREGTPA